MTGWLVKVKVDGVMTAYMFPTKKRQLEFFNELESKCESVRSVKRVTI